MNIQDILSVGDWNAILTELEKDKVTTENGYPVTRKYSTIKNWQKYYNGDHPILVDPERADYTNENGKLVKRSKIVLDYPQQIIKTATAMLLGEPADLVLNSDKTDDVETRFAIFDKVWKQYANMDSFNIDLLGQLMIESKIVEKLYFKGEPAVENIRSMRMCKKDGDEVFAHYGDDGEVDAITRKYSVTVVENGSFTEKQRTDIYTKDVEITLDENNNVIDETSRNGNNYCYAIYYDQFVPEWYNVLDLINAQEQQVSQTRDVNKRVGNPSIVAKGDVDVMPDPDEDVKVFVMKPVGSKETGFTYGGVDFLESQGAREAIDREATKFDNYIYKFTWPDLSFLLRELKTGNLSGTAIKLMFTDALASVALKKSVISKGFQQKIDIIKEMLFACTGDKGYLDLDITLKFNSILPDNVSEVITQIQDSVSSGTMSKKQGVYKNPLNKGAEKEVLEEVEQEAAIGGTQMV